jgi:hypothetical protein
LTAVNAVAKNVAPSCARGGDPTQLGVEARQRPGVEDVRRWPNAALDPGRRRGAPAWRRPGLEAHLAAGVHVARGGVSRHGGGSAWRRIWATGVTATRVTATGVPTTRLTATMGPVRGWRGGGRAGRGRPRRAPTEDGTDLGDRRDGDRGSSPGVARRRKSGTGSAEAGSDGGWARRRRSWGAAAAEAKRGSRVGSGWSWGGCMGRPMHMLSAG